MYSLVYILTQLRLQLAWRIRIRTKPSSQAHLRTCARRGLTGQPYAARQAAWKGGSRVKVQGLKGAAQYNGQYASVLAYDAARRPQRPAHLEKNIGTLNRFHGTPRAMELGD